MESTIRIPNMPSWFGNDVDTTKDATATGRPFGVSSFGGTGSMGMSFVLLCALGGSLVFPEQSFFSRGNKTAPTLERTKELLETLKTSGDEGLRMAAVDELRLLDTQSSPMAVTAMIETLKTDRKPGVRAEAAVSLSRMRPVRPEIGQALEHAISKDASMRVRMQARSALLQYNLAGFRSVSPVNNSPAQLDPLGEIAKEDVAEPPALPARPWTWMAFQNNWFGPPGGADTNQPANPGVNAQPQTSEPRSWMRPGKAVVGWFQGVFGSQKENNAKENASAAPLIPPAGLNVPPGGTQSRTVSNPGRGPAPGILQGNNGSLGTAGNTGPLPSFPPVPDFRPGSPVPDPAPAGPDLGKPNR